MIQLLVALIVLLPAAAAEATEEPAPTKSITVTLKGEWIVASQGNDEDSQVVRVLVWGDLPPRHLFVQLDDDPEREYVVISRNVGTGLQR